MRISFSVLLTSLTLFSASAFANTQILFSKDGSKVTIMLLAFTQNPDSTLLYQTMNQAPVVVNGKDTKRIGFATDDGAKSFDLNCVFSKLSEGTGSCILVLQAGPHLQQDPGLGRALYTLSGPEAQRLAKEFVLPPAGTSVFRSSDGLLNIGAFRDSSGAVESFQLTYGN